MGMNIITNELWDECSHPIFTIITPIYNRRDTIERTMESVRRQGFKNFEYILIEDGSTEPCDDLVLGFIDKCGFPAMLIKKENGGVHTARNIGYDYGRGFFVICIDSDDELLPDACSIFWNAWNSIPEKEKDEYWQLKALCIDDGGKIVSSLFPEDINEMPKDEAYKYFSMSSGEQLGCRLLSIMKGNKFPEPRGVKFVNEIVLYSKLEKVYRSYGINKPVRIYHTDSSNRLCGVSTKTIQSVKNAFWNSMYALNNSNTLIRGVKEYWLTVLRLKIMENILKEDEKIFLEEYKVEGVKNKTAGAVMALPGAVGALIYRKKKMRK